MLEPKAPICAMTWRLLPSPTASMTTTDATAEKTTDELASEFRTSPAPNATLARARQAAETRRPDRASA